MNNNKQLKLLICTQVVDQNDANLGFFHQWLREFAKNCDKVTVICLKKGDYDLPGNVRVLSLGKENKPKRLSYILKFYKYIWAERNNYNAVFVHMNVEYILLGGWFWRLLQKKIILWYTHKSVTSKLRLAEKLTNVIMTASSKSFRLPSSKLKVMGHGIDTEYFKPIDKKPLNKTIISTGRICRTKQIMEMVKLYQNLKSEVNDLKLLIIGSPIYPEDKEYLEELKDYVKDNNLTKVAFTGPVNHFKILEYYQKASLFFNLSKTGSLDKSVLEAMACEIPVLTTNEAFKNILAKDSFAVDNKELNKKALRLLNQSSHSYRDLIINNYSLPNLIKNIINTIY